MSTKLEKLLIGEVSGVDVPANLVPGWMVRKGASVTLPLGPDEPWNVGEAEARVRKHTGADAGPNAAYAACYLYPTGDEVPESFADYKFLVVDVVKGELAVMPAALRAVAERLPNADIPAADKESLTKAVATLIAEPGVSAEAAEEDRSLIEKIVGLLRKESDVTVDELNAALDERMDALAEGLAERLSKSEDAGAGDGTAAEVPAAEGAETPAETPPAVPETPAEDGDPTAVTAEDVDKAITEAMAPVLETVEKILDFMGAVNKNFSVRKSLDGQEGGTPDPEAEGTEGKAEPTKKHAIGGLIRGMQNGDSVELT